MPVDVAQKKYDENRLIGSWDLAVLFRQDITLVKLSINSRWRYFQNLAISNNQRKSKIKNICRSSTAEPLRKKPFLLSRNGARAASSNSKFWLRPRSLQPRILRWNKLELYIDEQTIFQGYLFVSSILRSLLIVFISPSRNLCNGPTKHWSALFIKSLSMLPSLCSHCPTLIKALPENQKKKEKN